MRKRAIPSMIIVALLLLSACVGATAQPLSFAAAPWRDGETTEYDILDASGAIVGTTAWTWQSLPEGWALAYDRRIGERQDGGNVTLDTDLFPLHSQLTLPSGRYEATYGPTTITIDSALADGSSSAKELRRPAAPIDNSQSLQTNRALPLTQGYVTEYTTIVPGTGAAVITQVRVVGAESITVPAGTFETWRVELRSGQVRHDAWYAQEEPHLLIKYRNRSAGSELHLRRWRSSADAAWHYGPSPEIPAQIETTPPNWGAVATAFLVQYPLMLIVPLLLGWWIKRRYGVGWITFAAGALTFIGSQVVHLPLNWALGLLGEGNRGVALWPLPWVALVAGLSAGICENLARWLMIRFGLRRTRSWAGALQLGAGHGGIEALVFGVLALLGMVNMLALSYAGQSPGVTAPYWQTPWYVFALAGFERVFVIAFHIAMSMLVMRAVVRKRIGYLLAAIAAHSAMDFWAVWAVPTLGIVWTEVGLAFAALLSLALILRLREPHEQSHHEAQGVGA